MFSKRIEVGVTLRLLVIQSFYFQLVFFKVFLVCLFFNFNTLLYCCFFSFMFVVLLIVAIFDKKHRKDQIKNFYTLICMIIAVDISIRLCITGYILVNEKIQKKNKLNKILINIKNCIIKLELYCNLNMPCHFFFDYIQHESRYK